MASKPKAPPGKAPMAPTAPARKAPAGAAGGDRGAAAGAAAGPAGGNATGGAGGSDAAQAASSVLNKRSQMEIDFERLRGYDKLDEGVDAIGPRGLHQLCTELGIAFGDFDMYVVAWKLGATQSYCITRSEWLHSAFTWKIDHIGNLRSNVGGWRARVKEDEAVFTEMYFHLYDFIRGDDEKLLPLEKAVKAWQVLLPEPTPFAFLSLWVQWVAMEFKRNITRDVWRQLWEFARKIKDLNQYDPNDKWPTALDDFVEWAKEKTGIKKP